MLVAIFARDKANHLQTRMDNRPAHLEHIEATGLVSQSGPLLDENGEMCGSLVIVEVDDIAQAHAWSENDPYRMAGLFESVSIVEWNRIIGP